MSTKVAVRPAVVIPGVGMEACPWMVGEGPRVVDEVKDYRALVESHSRYLATSSLPQSSRPP